MKYLICLLVLVSSCSDIQLLDKKGYYIEQWFYHEELITSVYHDHSLLKQWQLPIDSLNVFTKTREYERAKELVVKLQLLDPTNPSPVIKLKD